MSPRVINKEDKHVQLESPACRNHKFIIGVQQPDGGSTGPGNILLCFELQEIFLADTKQPIFHQ